MSVDQKKEADEENQSLLGVVEEPVKDKGGRRAKSVTPKGNQEEENGSDVTCLTCMGTCMLPLEGARELQPNKSVNFLPVFYHSDVINNIAI